MTRPGWMATITGYRQTNRRCRRPSGQPGSQMKFGYRRHPPETSASRSPTRADEAVVAPRPGSESASHADPKTTIRYAQGRGSLVRDATYSVPTFLPAPRRLTRSAWAIPCTDTALRPPVLGRLNPASQLALGASTRLAAHVACQRGQARRSAAAARRGWVRPRGIGGQRHPNPDLGFGGRRCCECLVNDGYLQRSGAGEGQPRSGAGRPRWTRGAPE